MKKKSVSNNDKRTKILIELDQKQRKRLYYYGGASNTQDKIQSVSMSHHPPLPTPSF